MGWYNRVLLLHEISVNCGISPGGGERFCKTGPRRNRVQKVLEDANVKLGNVLSDVFGMSGQAMLEALLEHKRSAAEIALLGQQMELACTVPGIQTISAASILAETGMDMSPEGPFPDCHHLASWATVCPGNNESAGKRRSGRTRQGNRWLRATLTQRS